MAALHASSYPRLALLSPPSLLQPSKKLQIDCRTTLPLVLPSSSFKGISLRPLVQQMKQKQCFLQQKFKLSSISAYGSNYDPANYSVKKVTGEQLSKLLDSERTIPLVVDLYATWCGPCIMLAQQLETLAVEYDESVQFIKIDTDEEHELANQLQIRGLPTILFISPDPEKPAIRAEGLLPNETIKSIIDTEL